MPPPTQPEVASKQRPIDPLPTLMPEHETSTPFDYDLIFTSTDRNRYFGESEEGSGISPFEEILTKSGEARSKVTTEEEFSTGMNSDIHLKWIFFGTRTIVNGQMPTNK